MRYAALLALVLAGCASFDGRGLAPGQSTAADVERVMGRAAETRQVAGETWYYYPRQPYGRQVFVARVGADGRLLGVEPRLTDDNIRRIAVQQTRSDEVRALLGPPYLVTRFPRLEREVWQYHVRQYGDPGIPMVLYVQFSPDGVAREVYRLDDTARPNTRS